jgi:hypothetical protein
VAHCTTCGAGLADDLGYCTQCGTAREPAVPTGVPSGGGVPLPAVGHGPGWYVGVVTVLVVILVLGAVIAVRSFRGGASKGPVAIPSASAPAAPSTGLSSGYSTASSAPAPTLENLGPGADVNAPPSAPNGHDAEGGVTSYGADHLVDGDLSTAWRMRGNGAGRTLSFQFQTSQTVIELGLVNGYAKTDPYSGEDRYRQERRITQVTWLLNGSAVAQSLLPSDRGPQSIRLAAPAVTTTVQLRIDATVPGDGQYDYTAISEVIIGGM